MKYIDLESMIERLERNNPDKMLLEDGDAFTRGLLAGKVELIMEMKAIIEREEQEDEEE